MNMAKSRDIRGKIPSPKVIWNDFDQVAVNGVNSNIKPAQKGAPMYRIFIIEDDEIIANLLKKNLCSWGYDVSCAQDFSNIIQEFARLDPQLVLLDLKLPFYNGFHWCEEIRRISQVPIIFISSAADNMNMVMAMSRGADDFIAKPFDMDVLTAKIQAILRRTYSFGTPGNVLEYKGALLNPPRCTLTWNGHDIALTKGAPHSGDSSRTRRQNSFQRCAHDKTLGK